LVKYYLVIYACITQHILNLLSDFSVTDERISSLEKELANANELLEVSRSHERQLTSQDDAEIVSSAAATVSRLLKSGMTLTQVRFTCFFL